MALAKHLLVALVAILAATGGSARVLNQDVPPVDSPSPSPSPSGKYDGMVGPPFDVSPSPSVAVAPDCGVAYQDPKEIGDCCAGKTAIHEAWSDPTCAPDPSTVSPPVVTDGATLTSPIPADTVVPFPSDGTVSPPTDGTVSPPPSDTTVSPPPIVTPPTDITVDTTVGTVVAPNIVNDLKNLLNSAINNVNNNVNENHITIAWPNPPASTTGGASSSSSSSAAAASAGGATAAVATPGCPVVATPPPAITRYDLKATSARAQFDHPANAWTSKTGVPGVNATGFVGCDGKPAIRAPSDTLADCQRYATSLQFATALMWNSTGKYCIPLRSIDAPLPIPTGTDLTVSTWSIGYEPANITIDGNCAKTATVFSA